jgi:hypothetical protein
MRGHADKVLMEFADAYLREAHPNPTRTGCPSDQDLQILAEHPTQADVALAEHISCCSPCYVYYAALLLEQKRQLRPFVAELWLYRTSRVTRQVLLPIILLVISVGVLYFLTRLSSEGRYTTFTIDFRQASRIRGIQHEPSIPKVRVPRRSQDLVIQLPTGSEEGTYRISLQDRKSILWSEIVEAHLVGHITTVNTRANLRPFNPGTYKIIVESSGGTRFECPIELTSF